MYYIRQEFLSGGKLEEIEVLERDFIGFKNKYFSLAKQFRNTSSYDDQTKRSARIYLGISFDCPKDLERKEKVLKALSPVFEIALDKAYDPKDRNYLVNFRRQGFEFELRGDMMIFSLGDSNDMRLSFSMAALVYANIYEEENLEKFHDKFSLINDSIIQGGYNSASFNGLQGYYFSNYFVKWLIDLRKYAHRCDFIDQREYEAIFDLIDNLENPKDSLFFSRN
ncbi:MAG: hypothetical protein Q4E50_01910 [Tissierellia bacterium]|nr:hypothetical protein [Tissierellia bacterium]